MNMKISKARQTCLGKTDTSNNVDNISSDTASDISLTSFACATQKNTVGFARNSNCFSQAYHRGNRWTDHAVHWLAEHTTFYCVYVCVTYTPTDPLTGLPKQSHPSPSLLSSNLGLIFFSSYRTFITECVIFHVLYISSFSGGMFVVHIELDIRTHFKGRVKNYTCSRIDTNELLLHVIWGGSLGNFLCSNWIIPPYTM